MTQWWLEHQFRLENDVSAERRQPFWNAGYGSQVTGNRVIGNGSQIADNLYSIHVRKAYATQTRNTREPGRKGKSQLELIINDNKHREI